MDYTFVSPFRTKEMTVTLIFLKNPKVNSFLNAILFHTTILSLCYYDLRRTSRPLPSPFSLLVLGLPQSEKYGQIQYPRRRELCLYSFLPIQQRRNLDIGQKEPIRNEHYLD